MKGLFDTNIIIDLLADLDEAFEEHARYRQHFISRVTWIEILVGVTDEEATVRGEDFLGRFDLVELDDAVARETILPRQRHHLKLPDVIIWASARKHGALLVTRNKRDFPSRDPEIRMPYEV